MRRFLALATAAALCVAAPAHAWLAQRAGAPVTGTTVVLLSHEFSGLNASADRYMPVGYAAGATAAEPPLSVFPVAGNLTAIRAYFSATVSGTQQWVLTLRKNGADTALTCAITATSSQRCTASATVAFSPGDYATISLHPVNSPTTSGSLKASLLFTPTTANDTPLFAEADAMSASTSQAQQLGTSTLPLGTYLTRTFNSFPDDGTLDRLFTVSNAPGTAGSTQQYTYKAYKNTAATTLTCVVLETATGCSDITHQVSITGATATPTAGDNISFEGAPLNMPNAATAGFGVRYVPATAGTFALMTGNPSLLHTVNTYYYGLTGGYGNGNTNEALYQSLADSMTITKMSVKVSSAPGSGKSYAFTLRQNGVDTALTCTIADTATTCETTGTITVADGDLLATQAVPSGSPSTAGPSISYLAHR